MRFLPDASLYTQTDACLAFLRALPSPPIAAPHPTAPLPVHFFWQGTFGAKPALCLKSFLATQDSSRFACWLWLNDPTAFAGASANPHLAPFLPFIELRAFDLASALPGTPLEHQAWIAEPHTPAQLSDLARLLVAYHHGGLFSDLDALFLRDLAPLLQLTGEAEFGFQWSYRRYGTNAFCRHFRQSPTLLALMVAANLRQGAHPRELLDFDRNPPDLLILPTTFFSPLWLHRDRHDRAKAAPFDRFPDFFRRFRWWFRRDQHVSSPRDFFPGAFTYHWHGLWSAAEHRDSYAGVLAASFETELREKLPSLAQLPPFGETR